MDSPFYSRIESFIRNEMSESERKEFKEDLSTNEELAREFKLHQVEHEFMRLLREEDIHAKAESWKNQNEADDLAQLKSKKRILPLNTNRWYLIAASTILLISLSSLYFLLQNNNDYSELAVSFYVIPSEFSDIRNVEETKESTPINKGITAFKQQDYLGALTEFQKIPMGDPRYTKAQYLLAHTYYSIGEYSQAISLFKGLISIPTRKEEIEWYLILSYLNLDEEDTQYRLLVNSILKNPDHSYYNDVVKLDEKLK